MCVCEVCVFGPERGGQRVTVVAELVTALYDQGHGVVMAGSQLVAVEDKDLGTAHLLLTPTTTTTI